MRAKDAAAAPRALLDEDSLDAATPIPGLSERGARRLFDRRASLGAIRERTGRGSFGLYGLLQRAAVKARRSWREWMGRVEAVLFACPEPASRETLARVVGKACNLDSIIDDIRDELRGRPYELANVAGGWSLRTKLGFGNASRTALGGARTSELSKANAVILMAVGYFTTSKLSESARLGFAASFDLPCPPRPSKAM